MIVDQKLNKGFVGVYLIDGELDGTQLATTVKPNGFRRLMTRLFIGWKWISVQQLKAKQKKAAEEAKALAEAKAEAEKAEKEVIRLGEEEKVEE